MTGKRPFPGGGGVPLPRQGEGYPFLGGRGYAFPGRGGYPFPGWGRGTPFPDGGLLPTGTALCVLATRRAVCFLRSRRRTFLFLHELLVQEYFFMSCCTLNIIIFNYSFMRWIRTL